MGGGGGAVLGGGGALHLITALHCIPVCYRSSYGFSYNTIWVLVSHFQLRIVWTDNNHRPVHIVPPYVGY